MKRTVGIQVGAISFLDEGIDPVLDLFAETAGVNNLFLATHTFDRGTGGRQIEGYPFPDHGKQEYDLDVKDDKNERKYIEVRIEFDPGITHRLLSTLIRYPLFGVRVTRPEKAGEEESKENDSSSHDYKYENREIL